MRQITLGSVLALIIVLLAGCKVQSAATPASGNTVTMGPNNFEQASITIKQGQTITFVDDKATGSLHILVIGKEGQAQSEPGAPDFKGTTGVSVEPGQSWTSPPWNTPGTYHVTCTVHPTTMNMIVTVTGTATTPAPALVPTMKTV
jgi:plastocyanin